MGRLSVVFLFGCATATAAPMADDPAGRRAVRGAALESAHESAELKALRELEAGVFPEGRDQAAPAGPKPEDVPWLAQIKMPDLPVHLEPRVVRYLELYKSDPRARAIMAEWLRAQGRWRPLFEEALRRAHLPLALIYVAMIESGYDPHDRSAAGAVGLWQFMPENSRIYGLRIDFWVDERKHPERATDAFCRYMTDLKDRFGSWPLALAAFNAGYGAVLKSMQKYNTNDYWELSRHEDGLPWETVLYVPKAMAAAIVGENRERFGYGDVKSEPAFGYEPVSVPYSMSFAQIARAAGVTAAEVEALNPELRRKRTPPEEPWTVRVPRGAALRFLAHADAEREAVRPVVVRFGERLDELARAAGASERELKRLNGFDDSAEVRPGVTLLVPDGRKPLSAHAESVIVAVPDKEQVVTGRRRIFYRTLAGDSVADVAAVFKVRTADLVKWNRLDPDARLAANMTLQVWVAPDFDAARVALVDPQTVRVVTTGSDEFFDLVEAKHGRVRFSYAVKQGDDLKKIGARFGLKVADLERINRFSSGATKLTIGQKLTVYRPMTAAERARAGAKLALRGAGVGDDPGESARLLPRPPPPQ